MEILYIAILILIIIVVAYYMYTQQTDDTFINSVHASGIHDAINKERKNSAKSIHSSLIDNPSPRGLTGKRVMEMEKKLRKSKPKLRDMASKGIYDRKPTVGDAKERYAFLNYVKDHEIDDNMKQTHAKFVESYMPYSNTSYAVDNIEEAMAMSFGGQGIRAFRRHAVPQSRHAWQITEMGPFVAARNNTALTSI